MHELDNKSAHPDLSTFAIDPCKQPSVQITGVAMKVSKEEATFEITVEQYISSFKSNTSTPQAAGGRLKPTTTFFCYIPDSPKYKNWGNKPLPGNNRYVSVSGFPTRVDRSSDGLKVEQFRIDVYNITFCGQYHPEVVQTATGPSSMWTLSHFTCD